MIQPESFNRLLKNCGLSIYRANSKESTWRMVQSSRVPNRSQIARYRKAAATPGSEPRVTAWGSFNDRLGMFIYWISRMRSTRVSAVSWENIILGFPCRNLHREAHAGTREGNRYISQLVTLLISNFLIIPDARSSKWLMNVPKMNSNCFARVDLFVFLEFTHTQCSCYQQFLHKIRRLSLLFTSRNNIMSWWLQTRVHWHIDTRLRVYWK